MCFERFLRRQRPLRARLQRTTTTRGRTPDDGDARRLLSDAGGDGGEKRTGGDGAQTRRTTRDDAQGTKESVDERTTMRCLKSSSALDAVGSAGYARGCARYGAEYEDETRGRVQSRRSARCGRCRAVARRAIFDFLRGKFETSLFTD